MLVSQRWLSFASFSLLSEFTPGAGQEYWHCDMKRGFRRVRKKEPKIAALLSQDTAVQRVGLLAQRGVYEFHHNNCLSQLDGVARVAAILKLGQESSTVRDRVLRILNNYQQQPVLHGRTILKLSRGDEGFPDPLVINVRDTSFNLFAAIDCIFVEPDRTLHILDFKTGTSEPDLRQAYIYLLAARVLYPGQPAIASFYNLETCRGIEPISATDAQLNAIQTNLVRTAQKHERERQQYHSNPADFAQIFPANPDKKRCQQCHFHSVCSSSAWEVSA